MSIINTKDWLDAEFDRPLLMMKRLQNQFTNLNPAQIYSHLQKHGMYKPNEKTKRTFLYLLEKDVWGKMEKLFSTYQQLWNGPDIPIFIFPFMSGGFLQRSIETKSGLAFGHTLFLFFDNHISDKEMEAVLIHEYHHVCRLHRLKKNENRLLDTMIMEGLAERTVSKYLGSTYLARWTKLYRESDFQHLWNRYSIQDKLTIDRSNPLYDHIMLGQKGYPTMLGYWLGYQLVKNSAPLSVRQSFSTPSSEILKKIQMNE